ncbi:MAG TPA: AAA family ATPase, partial [Planctomycetota bacterium]|nr:AAA family ATPase [Planctomycetota bacterium]
MRIDQFEIDAFGQLKGYRAEGLAGHPLLVVHGDNESGKTTLREFLATVLYGFSPAQADHPYTPWSGGTPGGRVALRLDDGRAMKLDRQLRDVAEGRLASAGSALVDLGNRPLPATGPVDRAIWDDVHAPRRDAPDGLSESTWALVRERLLGGAGAPGLRTAREATRALEARAAELWQPSRRARTRHRVLSVRIRRLMKERERASADLQRLLELRRQIGSRTGAVKTMEEQLGETRSRLLRAERLLPVVRGLQHAEDLRRRAGQALPQDDFPHDARLRIAELRSGAQAASERSTALAAELAAHEQRGMLSLQDQAVLASEDEIRTLVSEAAVHQQDLVHVNDLTRERDAQEAVFRDRSTNVFSGPLDAERRDLLGRLGLAELRSRIMDWEDAGGSPEMAQEELRQAKEQVKACELDFEAVPSADVERKLRQREELLRQLQAREDAWQALKKDVEAAKLARDSSSKRRRPHHRTTQAVGLFLASGCTLLTLLFGAARAWWFVVPAGLALAWFGWKTLKGKSDGAPVRGDESRYDVAHKECLDLRKQLQLHEFEPVAPHIEKAQQSLAHVASRPELERRLVLARQRADECATRLQERSQECEKVRRRVVEYVEALPMLPARLEQPGQDLLHDLEELRAALRAMSRLTGEQQAVAQRAREREARAARLAERLESNQHRSPMEASAIWHERLQLALSARRRAD